MARWFQRVAGRLCAAGIGVALASADIRAVDVLSLDVLIDVSVNAPDSILASARQKVNRIFATLGVNVRWFGTGIEQTEPRLDDPAGRRAFLTSLYVVRLVPRGGEGGMSPSDRALGFSAPGTRVSIITYPRVEALARSSGAQTGVVLGHVIAHELGHLLLGRLEHSATGLMQERLNVRLAEQERLQFTADEARSIRARLSKE